MKNKFSKILLSTISISTAYLWFGNYIYKKVVFRNFNKGKSSFPDQVENGSFDYERFSELDKNEIKIKSKFGYELDAVFIKSQNETENTIIISHGLGGDKWTLMKIADIYLDLNFNVLIFDQRAQGLSGGKEVSYGYYEKFDLESVIQFVKVEFPDGIIGVHGESLGASTAILHAGEINAENKNVKFYISDCPYSDLMELLKIRLKEDYYLPNFYFVQSASKISEVRSGFKFSDVSPISVINKVDVPILFIHGKNDSYVPTKMSVDLYKKKSGTKDLLLVENAAHAKSFSENKEMYCLSIEKFLDDVMNYLRIDL